MVRTGGAIAIGGLAQAVLAAGHTTDKAVQLVRSIAAQYGDRLAQTVAKRLQQPLDQPPDVGHGGGVGRVVETTRDGGLTVNKLVDREIYGNLFNFFHFCLEIRILVLPLWQMRQLFHNTLPEGVFIG